MNVFHQIWGFSAIISSSLSSVPFCLLPLKLLVHICWYSWHCPKDSAVAELPCSLSRVGDGRSPRPKCHRFPMFLLEIQKFLSINDSWIIVYPWSISRMMKGLFLSVLCFAGRGFASLLIRPQSTVPPLNIVKLTFQKDLLTYTPRALIFLIK